MAETLNSTQGVAFIPSGGAKNPHVPKKTRTKHKNRSNVVTNIIKDLKNGSHPKNLKKVDEDLKAEKCYQMNVTVIEKSTQSQYL